MAENKDGAKQSKEFPLDLVEKMTKTVEGVLMPTAFATENILTAMSFRARDGDVVVATYPKSGTTWTQCIIRNLLYYDECTEVKTSGRPMEYCPLIEMKGVENLEPNCAHMTHLPFDAKRFNPRAKYIVVMRNPRDVCVSYYHHYSMMIPAAHTYPKGFWFPEYARMFISNKTWYGDYFKHALTWLEGLPKAGASDDNVLYVTYEKMKANRREELIRIANFIGGVAAERVKDEKVVDEILSRTSVDTMREDVNPKMGAILRACKPPEEAALIPDRIEFVRKGEVGDWKNHFTPEISAAFDAWIHADPEHEKVMKLFE